MILHWIASFFFFFLPPSLSLYRNIACFFGLERENVKRSNEKKSVGFFNCNVIYLFIFILAVFFFLNRFFNFFFIIFLLQAWQRF